MKLKLLIITLSAFAFALAGCGAVDRLSAVVTGNASEVCFKGVTYVQFTSGASVAYNVDGTIKLCN